MANRRTIDREERREARLAALRWLGFVFSRLLALALVATALPWAGISAYRWITTSPTFAIAEIEIVGLERTPELDLRARIGIAEGDNVFAVDPEAAADRLSTLPWVDEVQVRTRFPQGVIVEVLEREAVALVDLGHLYLVDQRGKVFKRAMPTDPLDLPVITGLPRDEWAEGGEAARERLARTLETLEIIEDHPLSARLRPQELRVDEGEGLTLFLGERGLMAKLGHGDVVRKLDRLSLVWEEASRRGDRIEVVRLDNRTRPEWIAVRLATPDDGRDAASGH